MPDFLPAAAAHQSLRQYSNVETIKTSVAPSCMSLKLVGSLTASSGVACALAVGSATGQIEWKNVRLTAGKTRGGRQSSAAPALASQRWEAHQHAVTDVRFLNTDGDEPLRLFSSSLDATVRLWQVSRPTARRRPAEALVKVYTSHSDAVRCVDVHPSVACFLSASEDGTWCLTDTESAAVLCRARSAAAATTADVDRLLAARCHPDGTLVAVGSQRSLGVWDVRANRRPVTTLEHPLANQDYVSVAFSDNGYHMASGQGNGRFVVWDLRSAAILHSAVHSAAVAHVAFDPSARFVAVGYGHNAAVYRLSDKRCRELVALSDNIEQLVGVQFVADPALARHPDPFLVTAAADATVRFFGNAASLSS